MFMYFHGRINLLLLTRARVEQTKLLAGTLNGGIPKGE